MKVKIVKLKIKYYLKKVRRNELNISINLMSSEIYIYSVMFFVPEKALKLISSYHSCRFQYLYIASNRVQNVFH